MLSQSDMLKGIRAFTLRSIETLSDEQLLKIPEGFNNNILWNLGHMVSSHQGILYRRQGLDGYVSSDFVENFKNGSSPKDWESTPDINEVKRLATELPEKFDKDVEAGVFEDFKAWDLMGNEISSVTDAETFNTFHEGLHYGTILALRKLV